MAKNDRRFTVVYKDGSELGESGSRRILVDKETGVHYIIWKSGYAGGITPLLGSDGKPVVTKSDITE